MLKYGGITLCVLGITFLCLFININCMESRKELRAVHKKMEIRLNGFQNELINALVEIEDIRESRAICTCPPSNTTATGQPDETKASRKEEIDSQTLRNYVERVTKGFDDEKKARKVFQKHLMNLVQDYIKFEDNNWSMWSPWGDCSVSCNGGIRTRTRRCDGTGIHQGSCLGNNVDIGGCNNNACVVPMVYFTMTRANSQLVSGKVTFSTTLANVGDGYNDQTGEFVCPVSGLYHFFFSFVQQSTTFVYCWIEHNDIRITGAYTYSDGTWAAASLSVYVQLAVGDVVTVGDCTHWQFVDHSPHSGVYTGSLIHP